MKTPAEFHTHLMLASTCFPHACEVYAPFLGRTREINFVFMGVRGKSSPHSLARFPGLFALFLLFPLFPLYRL